jgi:fumarylacetoacetase
MDPTNDPALRSWVPVPADSHFPIQNLPFGAFGRGDNDVPEIGVAIGDHVLSVNQLAEAGLLDDVASQAGRFCFEQQLDLNLFMMYGAKTWRAVRARLSELLRHDNGRLRDDAALLKRALVPMQEVLMEVPVDIHDYTDFYSSRQHATNVGIMMRGPDNALLPNWLHLPVAYHGRASSIVISGTDLNRPFGQTKADDASAPTFGPSRNLDFELEMGFFVGPGNELGQPIPIAQARDNIFGMVLVNDWSARDIQKWEYVPLGPFLAKNFGTSISPWVVMLDALEPFRVAGPVQDPQPLPYLQTSGPQAYDIHLEIYLQTAKMDRPYRLSASNTKHLYWNIAQQLAHHTVNGCCMQSGDLLASGTISGPTPDSYGSMLELAWKGTKPIQLPNGESRTFLEDGDRVTMTGWCQGPGYRVGFGEVTGKILPAGTKNSG